MRQPKSLARFPSCPDEADPKGGSYRIRSLRIEVGPIVDLHSHPDSELSPLGVGQEVGSVPTLGRVLPANERCAQGVSRRTINARDALC